MPNDEKKEEKKLVTEGKKEEKTAAQYRVMSGFYLIVRPPSPYNPRYAVRLSFNAGQIIAEQHLIKLCLQGGKPIQPC